VVPLRLARGIWQFLAGGFLYRLFDLANRALGFNSLPVSHQPAGRFGHVATNEDDNCSKTTAYEEGMASLAELMAAHFTFDSHSRDAPENGVAPEVPGQIHSELAEMFNFRWPPERYEWLQGYTKGATSSSNPDAMTTGVLDKIRDLLKAGHISFREVRHQPTHTSEESARARGEDLAIGAKAILAKTDATFRLFVVSADAKLDSVAIKRKLQLKKMRFATREELLELTGLVPGSVPPFGPPILPFPLYCDSELGKTSDLVAFNAGSLTVSIVMAASDWEKVARPERFPFRQK
jgi:prolyl-tRNA editing enzyme YbaK/EbsC (Cys-tRNA(Pro) deacylase)